MKNKLLFLALPLSFVVWITTFSACSDTVETEETEASAEAPSKEVYELKTYHLSSSEQQQLVENYLKDAAIPALNRLGISPVGVFTPMDTAQGLKVYVLTPFESLEAFGNTPAQLMADEAYKTAGAPYLDIAHPNKAYERIDSRLLMAFDSMPAIAIPSGTAAGKPRIFELRSYESYSEVKGIAKIRMFNEGGEVAIFKRLGFEPVFFAQAITGSEQPNLVYMITFDDLEEKEALWKAFGADPAWKAIKDLPEYANTVSKIHSDTLVPVSFSQL